MGWAMIDKAHQSAIPGSMSVFGWECDVLSLTKANMVHEYEIKITRSDYKADFRNKKRKHKSLVDRRSYAAVWKRYPENKNVQTLTPNYFWFVTAPMDIEIPEYAGHMIVKESNRGPILEVIKTAPRLHREKIRANQVNSIARGLAFRTMKLMNEAHLPQRQLSSW